jgi:hypothetical protein
MLKKQAATGKPWKIAFMCGTVLTNHDARNAVAAVQQWKKASFPEEVWRFSVASPALRS